MKKNILSVSWKNKYLLLFLIVICLPIDDVLLYFIGNQHETLISGTSGVIATILFFAILKLQKKI